LFNLYILRANYRYLLQTPDPFVTNEEYSIAINEAVSAKKITGSAGEMITSFIDLSEDSILQIARNRNSLKIITQSIELAPMKPDEIAVSYGNSDKVQKVFYKSFNKTLRTTAPIWFPTTKTLGDLHNYFLENGLDCVLLVDEYGDFFGAVSRYDICKYWQASCKNSETYEKLSEITADASSEVVKYQDWFSKDLLEKYDEIKTLNGILCAIMGKIPHPGESFSENGFVYHVVDADKTKIKKIKIEKRAI
jgi:CBS domain containing-hemolysin-like protein